jgi:hypothetical protein
MGRVDCEERRMGGGWWITQILRVECLSIHDLVSHSFRSSQSKSSHYHYQYTWTPWYPCFGLSLSGIFCSLTSNRHSLDASLHPSPFTHQSNPFLPLRCHLPETNSQISESSRINPSTFPTSLHPSYPRFSNGVNTTGPTPPLRRLPIPMIQGGRLQRLESGILS